MSETVLAQSTNFLMLTWCPDHSKTNEPLFFQIGGLEPDLLILEVLAKNFDDRSSLFTVYSSHLKFVDRHRAGLQATCSELCTIFAI